MTKKVTHQMRNAWKEIVAHEEAHEYEIIYEPLNFKFRGHVDGIFGVWYTFSSIGE